ncbi:hypothetical protein NliqN6_4721 [Naganishia liquefaciens]|uniref:Myotubularin phosphatase domain-containing protein n=1 Tax=Naganishia liquefaciens TaxID=104408 RepID=A0A8H3TWE8_9TREE|nr:hypothetical protein NliqN6_4721 [Naganishia liquefaciens]
MTETALRMDAIRVSKVDNVTLDRLGKRYEGTLHLTAHHLIFTGADIDEVWTPYPLINLAHRLPQTIQGTSPLQIRTRVFDNLVFGFKRDKDAENVFCSVKELTVATSIEQLYAFYYKPPVSFQQSSSAETALTKGNGWSVYNPREEYARMGLGTRTKAWRFTDINKDYSYSPTYPAKLVVPSRISDSVLTYAAKYRSKARIPALSYLHWAHHASITRCSQPLVGLKNSRSAQDERLVDSIFQSHISPDTGYGANSIEYGYGSSQANFPPTAHSASAVPAVPQPSSNVYGATTTNLIVDARPTTNAMANVAKGAGTENMENYKGAKKAYLGIDNIHVMRDSLNRLVEAIRDAENSPSGSIDRYALRRSNWLKHISALMDGTLIIVKNTHINSSHVLIHCSDGWDRTTQLSALAQVCLDPYYRTIEGFKVLVEKDWLSFGHKFLDRCGHLSSEKLFTSTSNTGQDDDEESGGPSGAERAAQAFLGAFQKQFTASSHIKEISPVFHQFLDCIRQVQRQYPKRFEYNAAFLETMHYHLYSCQFGTFLTNTERQRRVKGGMEEEGALLGPNAKAPICERTTSIWEFVDQASELEKFKDPEYDPSLDEPVNGKREYGDSAVLLPNPKDVKYWSELFKCSDEEMNGSRATLEQQAQGVEVVGPFASAKADPIVEADAARVVNSVAHTVTSQPDTATEALSSARKPPSRGGTWDNYGSSILPDTPQSVRSPQTQSVTANTAGNGWSERRSKGISSGGSSWNWSQISTGAFSALQGAARELQGAAREIKTFSSDAFNSIGSASEDSGANSGEMWSRGNHTPSRQSGSARDAVTSATVPAPWSSAWTSSDRAGNGNTGIPSHDNPWASADIPSPAKVETAVPAIKRSAASSSTDDINDVSLPSITDGRTGDKSLHETWVDVPSQRSTPKAAEQKTLAPTIATQLSEARVDETKLSGSWDPLGAL